MRQLGRMYNKNTSAAWLHSNLPPKLIKRSPRPRPRAGSRLISSSVVCLGTDVFERQLNLRWAETYETVPNVSSNLQEELNLFPLSRLLRCTNSIICWDQVTGGFKRPGKNASPTPHSPLSTFSISFPSYHLGSVRLDGPKHRDFPPTCDENNIHLHKSH